MINVSNAIDTVLATINTASPLELSIQDALGHILAQDITATLAQPPFSKSAMDGFVLGQEDEAGYENKSYEVIGTIKAGDATTELIPAGKTYKIMTGAMVPANASRVVMKENVEWLDGSHIKITLAQDITHIRLLGEELEAGSTLYLKGQEINSVVLANIASVGINSVLVYPKPKVGILLTGSELIECGQPYQPGKIYNSNGPLLQALLTESGVVTANIILGADELDALNKSFKEIINTCDALFISGGISVGDYDYVEQMLKDTGCTIHFNKVAIKPGKPFTFASYQDKPIFALPGNPVSALLCFQLFALPALALMQGRSPKTKYRTYTLNNGYTRKKADLTHFVPVKKVSKHHVETLSFQGSSDLYSLSLASGFMIIPEGILEISSGEQVEVLVI